MAVEHLKCGCCNWETEIFILIDWNLQRHMQWGTVLNSASLDHEDFGFYSKYDRKLPEDFEPRKDLIS